MVRRMKRHEDLYREIGRRFREKREEVFPPVSQEARAAEIRELLGRSTYSLRQYQRLEHGESMLEFPQLLEVAQAFGVDVSDLIQGSEVRSPDALTDLVRALSLSQEQSFAEMTTLLREIRDELQR
jgi:transcriptional regulator with XRE-family HTH domain